MNPPENQREVEVSEEAVKAAWDILPSGTTHREVAEALQAAAPLLCAQERERLLGEIQDWLGSDDEYGALPAIQAELEANPQLVPERDVPLRLLEALRGAVDRFIDKEAP